MSLLNFRRFNKKTDKKALEYAFETVFNASEIPYLWKTKIDAPSYVGIGRDGRIKAFIIVTKSEYCTLEKGQYFISYLGVLPRYQKCGYASQMLNMVKKYAIDICLHVGDNNEKAIRFYLKHGFEEVDRYKNTEDSMVYGLIFQWLK